MITASTDMGYHISYTIQTLFVVLLLMLHVGIPVSADVYEQFSNSSLDNWTIYAWDYDSDMPVDSSFSIQEGSLVSTGSLEWDNINIACIRTDLDEGYYRYDLFVPFEGNVKRFGFRISVFPYTNDVFPNTLVPNPSLVQAVVTTGVRNTEPELVVGQLKVNDTFNSDFNTLAAVFVSEEDIEGWHTYDLHKNKTHVTLSHDGQAMVTGELITSLTDNLNSICVWTDKGSGIKIDNIRGSTIPLPDNVSETSPIYIPPVLIYLFGAMIAVVALGVPTRKYMLKKKILKPVDSLWIEDKRLQPILQSMELSEKSLHYLIYGGYRVEPGFDREAVAEQIPQELLKFRYLMHPIRLSIMKLLDQNHKLTSVTIKHLMGVTWGEYRNHIKSLHDKGYVEIRDEFNEDGHLVQCAYILEFGRSEYLELVDILSKFIGKQSPLHSLLASSDEESRKFLYPDRGKIDETDDNLSK